MTTAKQLQMLTAIAEDELSPLNGATPDCADDATTWTNMVVYDAEDKGVFTSCMNAGLVWHSGLGRDSQCGLTDKGYAEYIASK